MSQSSEDTVEEVVKLNFYDLPNSERHFIAVLLTILFLMGIVGNTSILYVIKGFKPPHQYKPGRLLLIWMFGTDLALTFIMVLPATLTTFGWSGLPSESLACSIFGYTETLFAALENLIILVMSLERSFTIYFPLRTILNVRRTNASCLFCILASVLLSTTNMLINRFAYNPDALRCLADYYPEERKIQLFISGSTLLFVFVPMLTTIVVYVLILRIVCKSNQFGHSRASSQAIKTTLLVVGVYLLSAMPFIVARLYVLATAKDLPLRFRMFSTVMYMVNTAVNPYVYIVTNRSLRKHGHAKLAQSKKSNGFDASSVSVDPQSRAWALTRAVKTANTATRQSSNTLSINSTESRNRLVLRSMTSCSSRAHSMVSDTKSASPRLNPIEDVLESTSEVFKNESALQCVPVVTENGTVPDGSICNNGHSMAETSTAELVDKHE